MSEGDNVDGENSDRVLVADSGSLGPITGKDVAGEMSEDSNVDGETSERVLGPTTAKDVDGGQSDRNEEQLMSQ